MLSEEQGIKAIIALQAAAGGVIESEEQAKAGWNDMTEGEKEYTERIHIVLCGGFKDEDDKEPL